MIDEERMTLQTKIDALAETVEDIQVRVERIDESLRGNGRRGLYTDLALVEERMSSVEKFRSEVEGIRRWFVFGVLGLFASVAWNVAQAYFVGSAP